MNVKSLFILAPLFPVLFSCNGNQTDKKLFNGEIHYFDDKNVICKDVVSQHVPLDGIYTGMIAVYDSLLLCWDTKYPNYFINIFNIDTGKEIGYFCPKGQGPNEFSNTNPIYQFFKKGDDVMTLLDGDRQSLAFWNLTKSVQTGKTVYDTIIPNYKELGLFFFHLPDYALLNVVSARGDYDIREATTPYCEKRSLDTSREIEKMSVYKLESVSNPSASKPVNRFFNTWDALKPDGTKLVQAMSYLPQLNIIDTSTGEVIGYRMKGGPDYSLLQTEMKDLTKYYLSVQADDKYIYASYWGKEALGNNSAQSIPQYDQIHVFDWDGNLLYKLNTDQSFFVIWLDTIRNRLYTCDWNTDEIYYLDLDKCLHI